MRQSPTDAPYGATAFLARHPEEEDHDVVFFSNSMLAHTAFRVASLGDLLAFYRKIKEQGVPIKYSLNHANEFSFYFDDPEGHLIEIYWATNLPIPGNYARNRSISNFLRRSCSGRSTACRRISEFKLRRCRAERAMPGYSKRASESSSGSRHASDR